MRGVPDSEIEAVFAKYDQDGDMMLNAEEQKQLKEDLLKQAEQINKDIEVSSRYPRTAQWSSRRLSVSRCLGIFGPTWILINLFQDVKDRQEHGETLGLGLAPGPEGEVSPMSNDLLLEKLNKVQSRDVIHHNEILTN